MVRKPTNASPSLNNLQALVFFKLLVTGSAEPASQAVWGGSHWAPAWQPDYVMHADDDSFVRLDLLLPEMVDGMGCWGHVCYRHVDAELPCCRLEHHAQQPSLPATTLNREPCQPTLSCAACCLFLTQVSWPRTRHYWGYVWDGTGARTTAPIRNPLNKSHMPESQYPLDDYPPFCSGCGFVLSWDLIQALTAQPLPDYRLLVSN
jgi:hypothetical protein